MATRGALSIDGFALVVSVLVAVPTGSLSPSLSVCLLPKLTPWPLCMTIFFYIRYQSSSQLHFRRAINRCLQSVRNSNIQVLMGVPNEDLQSLASDPSTASDWVQSNVVGNWPSVTFRYIAVGNEVIPGDLARYVLPAMRNIQSALSSVGLQDQIKVSTAVSTGVLGSSYPPSAGAFSSAAKTYLSPILQFLASNAAPLFVNVYPSPMQITRTRSHFPMPCSLPPVL
ncbi:unnamed protein product [Musa banksii]